MTFKTFIKWTTQDNPYNAKQQVGKLVVGIGYAYPFI